jgi:hypothetical protein
MSAPMYSGIYYSVNDQRRILITQGLEGYTLVTKKKILFRLYLDLYHISQVTLVLVTVSYRLPDSNFNVKKYFTIPRDHLFVEKLSPNGPSIGIIFEGKVFDSSFLIHNVEFSVMVGDRVILRSITPDLKFLPSGRLRILIHALVGTAPWGNKIEQNFAWLIEMFQSLE